MITEDLANRRAALVADATASYPAPSLCHERELAGADMKEVSAIVAEMHKQYALSICR